MDTTSLLTELRNKYPTISWEPPYLDDEWLVRGYIAGVRLMSLRIRHNDGEKEKKWSIQMEASHAQIVANNDDLHKSLNFVFILYYQSRMARFIYDGQAGYDSWIQSISQVINETSF